MSPCTTERFPFASRRACKLASASLLAIALGRSIVGTNTEASRLLEVATQGIDMNLVDQRTDLPSPARRALAQALAFDPAARLTSSRELARAFQTQVG